MPKRNDSVKVLTQAIAAASPGLSGPRVHQEVVRLLTATGRKSEIPSLRNVQRWIGELRPDVSEPWTLVDSDPDDAATVLRVVGALIARPTGRTRPTKEEAEWIIRVAHAAPGLTDPDLLFTLARLARAGGSVQADVEDFLATEGWTPGAIRYRVALEMNRIRGIDGEVMVAAANSIPESGGGNDEQ